MDGNGIERYTKFGLFMNHSAPGMNSSGSASQLCSGPSSLQRPCIESSCADLGFRRSVNPAYNIMGIVAALLLSLYLLTVLAGLVRMRSYAYVGIPARDRRGCSLGNELPYSASSLTSGGAGQREKSKMEAGGMQPPSHPGSTHTYHLFPESRTYGGGGEPGLYGGGSDSIGSGYSHYSYVTIYEYIPV